MNIRILLVWFPNGEFSVVRPRVSRRSSIMETWRMVWREGFAPVLSLSGLEALWQALRSDDMRLTQGSTTTPPPLMAVSEWPVEAADAIGLCGWLGQGLESVGQVEEFFARICFEADQ